MGLRAKFNLVILAAFAVGFLIAAIVLNRVANDTARDQVLQNARIMMTAADVITRPTISCACFRPSATASSLPRPFLPTARRPHSSSCRTPFPVLVPGSRPQSDQSRQSCA